MTPHEVRAAVEAILFVAGEPVQVEDLTAAIGDATLQEIETALQEIASTGPDPARGVVLEKTAGGYRFATRPELDPYLRKFFAKRGQGRLSLAALETLSIIAYRQPITAPEVSEIRGVNSTAVIGTLLERRLIRIAGRKNVVGSPFLYRTTREFLTHFGLDTLQDLPKLEEFAEVLGETIEDLPLTTETAETEQSATPETVAAEES